MAENIENKKRSPKRIPYGMMNFVNVRERDCYYVDKTRFIEKIEDSNMFFFFIRPRRFGKSFAKAAYGETTMYNSNMVLYFIDNYVHSNGKIPDNMVEENIRVDYNKLRMLIRRDREFAHDASVIQNLVNNGYITGTLKTGFPAENIGDPDNFISLLYYFGMVTIAGTHEGDTKFVIPNEVVREQIFRYLLDTYKENDHVRELRDESSLQPPCLPRSVERIFPVYCRCHPPLLISARQT